VVTRAVEGGHINKYKGSSIYYLKAKLKEIWETYHKCDVESLEEWLKR
jgi:hypothetical protein